jgi:RNA polymerase sigma-70 factor (ECF subfamily)
MSNMRATTIAMTDRGTRTWAEFEALVEPRVDGLFRLAAAIVGPDDARDVTQDALVRAWHGFGGLRSPDALDAWLRAIVVNGCRNVLRSRRRSVRSIPVESAAEVPARGAPLADAFAERDRLDRAFEGLSPDDRAILALRFSLDLPIREVAAALDIPEGTAKSRLHKATARLRDLLRET